MSFLKSFFSLRWILLYVHKLAGIYYLALLKEAMQLLVNEEQLSADYKLHPLEPKSQIPKRWGIHIGGRKSDWVLVFYYYKQTILFERTRSHVNLFRK
ncbi:type II toxin-antitoxin system YafQ family toxin [Ligilactobacillus agilis]